MVIDRIEDNVVICEDEIGKMCEISIDLFIKPIHDGDVVVKNENGLYEVDLEKTQSRRKNIENRFDKLFK